MQSPVLPVPRPRLPVSLLMQTGHRQRPGRKLEKLSELRGLRKDVRRIAVALERLAGIESQDSDEEQISWPESDEEETEVQESTEKGKQREQRSGGVEVEGEVEGQEEEDVIEGVEEGSGGRSLVAYSVRTVAK